MLEHANYKKTAVAAAIGALFVGASALSVANAQTAPTDDSVRATASVPEAPGSPATEAAPAKIIVTGTLLRGIAPVGTNIVAMNSESIKATGATSTIDLLATVPQITSAFNAAPSVGSGASGNTIVRPNIRNITANGGNTTLVLMDGHNMVGAGILQTTPDANMLPPGALQRIDVVLDGGSSLYGSDAIGGIVNFITRKRMQGIEVEADYGSATKYSKRHVGVTGGHDWGSGSALLSYDYRKNANLLGVDRSYFRQDLSPFGGTDRRVLTCSPGNVVANGVNYALPGLVAGTKNLCDPALVTDIFPQEVQKSAFGSITQDLSDRIEFNATAYYADRQTTAKAPQILASSATITSSNPYFKPIGTETSQSVSFNYADAFGPSINNLTTIIEYGFTPSLKFDLGNKWEASLLANYGHSVTTAHSPLINTAAQAAALAGTTTATALNPYSVGLTNAGVLNTIRDFEQYATSTQELKELRLNVDGPLMSIAGGDIRLAGGMQYQTQSNAAVQTDAAAGDLTNAARASADRTVRAIFGELYIPVVSSRNQIPGISSLELDASVRYDDYSDFGGTTNPKLGFNYSPIESVKIRGSYGTSFNAPSLADTTGAVDTRAQVLPVSPFQKGSFSPVNFFRPTILLAGGTPNLKPQTADTWSVGIDYKPAFVSGLNLGLTYWNVAIFDEIALAPFTTPTIFSNPAYAKFYVLNPTLAQAQALVGNQRIQGESLASVYSRGGAYAIFHAQRQNLGNEYIHGIDYAINYKSRTAYGVFSADLGGTYLLTRESQTARGDARFDQIAAGGISRLQLTGSLGIRGKNMTAIWTERYSSGFNVAGITNQTHVGAFRTTDLYLAYDFPLDGSLKGTSLSLNFNNLFDQKPAYENISSTNGVGNGQTVGRLVNLRLRKKF